MRKNRRSEPVAMNAARSKKDKPQPEPEPVQEETAAPSEEETAALADALSAAASKVEESAWQEKEPTVEEQLKTAIAERDANYDRFLRVQAELENYRRRVRKEAEQNRLYQALPLVKDLLPGLDNLQRALAAAESTDDTNGLLEGVRMVAQQFQDALASHAVVPIEALGEPFDPHLHEALGQIPSPDHPPMVVIEEVQRGYLLHDRVVRPSKVIVSSGPPAETGPPDDSEESEPNSQ
jgi:molecular chaperone GrpE